MTPVSQKAEEPMETMITEPAEDQPQEMVEDSSAEPETRADGPE